MDLIDCRNVANNMLAEYGLAQEGWTFAFDNAKSRGGICMHSKRQISMSRVLVPLWEREDVRQVLLHEIAHALVGVGHGHNAVWARKARMIGYTGKRTHDLETAQPRYRSFCPKCQKDTGTRHRMNARMRYAIHTKCGTPVEWTDSKLDALV